jgi:hypothetical protein
MNLFEQAFNKIITEDNVAGGAGSVFGAGPTGSMGSTGNQFPAQNDKGYAPGDARVPSFLGSVNDKRKKKLKKKTKTFFARRPFSFGM